MEILLWAVALALVVAALLARRGRVAAILMIAALYAGAVATSSSCDAGIEVCRG